ncbi:MAG: hypothetical protein LBT59_23695, partial [Clostridiales bacterium]|nr:hypothetical protein [Clostridiales bacterium]
MMIDFYPTKAQYRSNEPIALMFEHGGTYLNSIAVLSVYHLNSKVHCQYISIDSDPLLIPLPILHGAAFGAELTIGQSRFSTAFDVTETPGFPVRYGFLSDFAACDSGADDVMQMAKYHINTVQFYDWSFRHDQLVSDQDEYSDMMGRKVSLPVVKEKIEACHNQGMQALGYGAIYAASKPFYEKHRDWGLYTSAGDPHIFINTFCIMN